MSNPLLTLVEMWLRRYRRTVFVPEPERTAIARAEQARPVVVITGASEGIGRALAECFAAKGHDLLLIARGPDPLGKAAADLMQRYPVGVAVLALDVTTSDAGDAIARAAERNGCYVDILVNNAGIGLGGPFAAQEADRLAALLDLNVRALTLLCRRFAPEMQARGRGGILNIASLGGYAPGPYQAAYYASKAYVISLTRAIAYEMRGQGVRITVVAPGPVETRFHAKMGADAAFYRYALRGMSPAAAARSAVFGFTWGFPVIWPGLITPVLALVMSVTPGIISIPIIGLLLWRRGAGDAGRS